MSRTKIVAIASGLVVGGFLWLQFFLWLRSDGAGQVFHTWRWYQAALLLGGIGLGGVFPTARLCGPLGIAMGPFLLACVQIYQIMLRSPKFSWSALWEAIWTQDVYQGVLRAVFLFEGFPAPLIGGAISRLSSCKRIPQFFHFAVLASVFAIGVVVPRIYSAHRRASELRCCQIPHSCDFGCSNPLRDASDQPDKLLDALNIRQGATVADVGAGGGYFTWRLAERVGPTGRVIAVEIDQKLLDSLADEMKRRNLTNVETVLGGIRDPHLPENAVDLALLVRVYHEFAEPEEMIKHIRQALRPDGRLVLVEYRKEDPSIPFGPSHKMTVKEVRSGIEPLGFKLQRVLKFLPTQHIIIFDCL